MAANNQLIMNCSLYPGVRNPYIRPLYTMTRLATIVASIPGIYSSHKLPREFTNKNNCADMWTKCSLNFIRLLTDSDFGVKGKIWTIHGPILIFSVPFLRLPSFPLHGLDFSESPSPLWNFKFKLISYTSLILIVLGS